MFKVDELLKASKGKLLSGDRNAKVSGVSIDSRTIKPGEVFIAIKGDNFDGHHFIKEAIKRKARVVICQSPVTSHQSPVKVSFIKVEDTVKALGDIAGCWRQKFDIPVIVVTGSNGKTTTKEMISQVLSAKFKVLKNEGTQNNHIGLPQALLKLSEEHEFCVLEAGTNHPGEIACLAKIAKPNIAVITNVGHSHLEFLKDLKGVLQEKLSLLDHLRDPRIALLNADDKLLRGIVKARNSRVKTLSVGINTSSDFFASQVNCAYGRIGFLVNQKEFALRGIGRHNVYNALFAIGVGRIFGMEYNDIARGLEGFCFLENRLSIKESGRIKFINDTYNSNPLSLKEALESLKSFSAKGRKIFIMGDMLELGKREEIFHSKAGQDAAKACDIFVAVGDLSKIAASAAKLCGFKADNLFMCGTAREAKELLLNRILPGPDDIVLVKGSRSMKMEKIIE